MVLLGVLALFIWLYLLLARGQFWLIRPAIAASGPSVAHRRHYPGPERSGRHHPRSCLAAATKPLPAPYLPFDDASSDNTARAALATAAALQQSDRLTVIDGAPLPSGWSGKLWAIAQGVERANAMQPDYFLFTGCRHRARTGTAGPNSPHRRRRPL